jgi:NAD(P)-dependent dehydrogenase (short-subunit alcohol dehydrogenase family)
MDLRSAVALVTGASSGIGRSIATELAASGATVVAVARRQAELAETVAACRGFAPDSYAAVADVSTRAACDEVVAEAEARLGRVDVVVNNAGVSLHRNAVKTTVEEVEHVLRVNFLGAVYLSYAALPGMLARRRGWIVNITSVAGYIPNPNEAAYGASKAALSLWTHGLAVDLAGTGVRAGVVSPGPIDTEIWEKEAANALYKGKLHPPEVVARGVLGLLRDGRVHRTVPRRYGLVGAMYPLAGAPIRWGLRRFGQQPPGR